MNKKKLQALRVRCTQLVILLAFLPQLSWQATLSFVSASHHSQLKLHSVQQLQSPPLAHFWLACWSAMAAGFSCFFLDGKPLCSADFFMQQKEFVTLTN
jgi:hypothetical protein